MIIKKILILVNHDKGLYSFRRELVQKLIENQYEVTISSPYGDYIEYFKELGCKYSKVEFNRHGTNPINEIKLLYYYHKLLKTENPDIVFSYTIKPNIYGALAAKKRDIPFIANITGLGTAVENPGVLQKVTIQLYKIAFSKVKTIFFQNKENMIFFKKNNIAPHTHKLLPGSGVNLEHFKLIEYPEGDTIEFVFISRIMKQKGIDQYLEAAKYIKNKYPYTKFHVCGSLEEDYSNKIFEYQKNKIIEYHGRINDIREILKISHCTVHPTYYPEGMSNVLLESAASGRPIISTNRSGTREIIDDGVNGYLIKERDTEDLIDKLEDFLRLTINEKKNLGLAGREKVVQEFDRQIVIKQYLNEIEIVQKRMTNPE